MYGKAFIVAGCLLLLLPDIGTCQNDVRQWLPAPVVTATIKDVDGSLFGNPGGVFPGPNGDIVVVNRAENSILAFSNTGTLRWSFGRRGGGPGEFVVIQDIDLTLDGNVLVLDRELGRITIVDGTSGAMIDEVPLPRVEALELVPSANGGELAYVEIRHVDAKAAARPWWAISEAGNHLRTVGLPVSCSHTLSCETLADASSDGGAVVAFRWSSRLMFLSPDGSVRTVVDGVEPIAFPDVVSYPLDPDAAGAPEFITLNATRIDPEATEATLGVSADRVRTFVLFLGDTENRGRIVDVYATTDGGYIGSYLLPVTVSSIAILADGRLATLRNVLVPEVTVLSLP